METIARTIDLPATITFTHGGHENAVPTASIPDNMLVMLMVYGRRKANDTLNSKASEARNAAETAALKEDPELTAGEIAAFRTDAWNSEAELVAWVDSLQAGTLGTGRGGPRGNEQDRFERDWLRGRLAEATGTARAAIDKATKGAASAADVYAAIVAEADREATEAHFADAMAKAWADEQANRAATAGLKLNLNLG